MRSRQEKETYLLRFRLNLLIKSLALCKTRLVDLISQIIRIPSQDNQPTPELLHARAQRRVLDVLVDLGQLLLELVLIAAQCVPPITQHLHPRRQRQAPLAQLRMPPLRLERAHRVLEVVARQDLVQTGVDGMQLVIELSDHAPLEKQARNDSGKAGAQYGDVVRPWLLRESLFPFLGVVVRSRLVEGSGVLIDLVVEVRLKSAVGVGWVPFLSDDLNLLRDRLLVCTQSEVSKHCEVVIHLVLVVWGRRQVRNSTTIGHQRIV